MWSEIQLVCIEIFTIEIYGVKHAYCQSNFKYIFDHFIKQQINNGIVITNAIGLASLEYLCFVSAITKMWVMGICLHWFKSYLMCPTFSA